MEESTLSTPAATAGGAGSNPPTITIDILKDLASTAALKQLLTGNKGAIISIAKEVATFAGQPVSAAAAAGTAAQLALSADISWDIPDTPITFSLAASAMGAITISNASKTHAIAEKLDSPDTTNVTAITPAGQVYVNIDLAVSITGTVGASGNINGIGIKGIVSDGQSATLSFSQPVDGTLETLEAIKLALSQVVFPLDPSGLEALQIGSLSRVVFDGTFEAQASVTYGLGDHTFAAPGVASALASAQKVVSITPPSVEINAGVKGAVTYLHTDHFALIIDKSSATVATIYLTRALESDAKFSIGFNAAIKTTNISVAIDPTALQAVVKDVTKNDDLATAVVNAAHVPLNNLVTSVNAKLTTWANEVTGGIGLNVGLDNNKKRNVLFVFEAASLASPNLTKASWLQLVSGDIVSALNAGGLTLQPGSGVSENIKRSATINFQFFNLFSFVSVSDFFSKASAELGPDGTIRLIAYIGDEASQATKKSRSLFCIYFVVRASTNAAGAVISPDVNLRIELSETNNTIEGASFVDTLSLVPVPVPPAVTTAQQTLGKFLGGKPSGKVSLIFEVKASAYGKLTFSPYMAGKPGPLPHTQDASNWQAFHAACTTLPPKLTFLDPTTFGDWIRFNQASIDQPNSTINPDRRHIGATASGLTVLQNTPARQLVGYYLQASQSFMNLCEDLAVLATQTASVSDFAHYNDLLGFITKICTTDIYTDYAVPTAGALLHQLSATGTNFTTAIAQPADNSSITCTLTLS